MVRIVATDEQAKKIAEAKGNVEIVDSKGNRIGYFSLLFADEDIRIAKERLASDERRKSTKDVIDKLQSMED